MTHIVLDKSILKTTLNHIRFVLPQYQRQFFFRFFKAWQRARHIKLEQRCLDSYRQRQISQPDCETSSRGSKLPGLTYREPIPPHPYQQGWITSAHVWKSNQISARTSANVMCGSFMFSWMTTTGRRKFSIILAPKRKYVPLMMWKMTIWTLWSLQRSFFVKRYAEEYKKTCR